MAATPTSIAGAWVLLLDLLSLLLAATLDAATQGIAQELIIALVLAPFFLYEQQFGALASRGRIAHLILAHALRFAVFAGVVIALSEFTRAADSGVFDRLLAWLAAAWVLTSFLRLPIAGYVRHLQRRGKLTEVVAVVGAGPMADRLVRTLQQTPERAVEVLGVFDDRLVDTAPGTAPTVGTLAQLIELGQLRRIDWIVLALPATAHEPLLSTVKSLKALSVPIALWHQPERAVRSQREVEHRLRGLTISRLDEPASSRWSAAAGVAQALAPRWCMTLMSLAMREGSAGASWLRHQRDAAPRLPAANLNVQFDDYDLVRFAAVAADFGQSDYGYTVTPNADHLIRLHESESFRALYATASYVLLDSRFLSHLLRFTRGIHLPVCTGSDLTAKLLAEVVDPQDRLVLIGGSERQAEQLRERYGLRRLAHFNPPMGFIRDEAAVLECLRFVEAHSPFRFCLLALGSPQQESVARRLQTRGVARGMALCIGASINFLTGDERRSPLWMQRGGIEWVFRLLQAPSRMAERYLVRGPRVFALLRHARLALRSASPLVRWRTDGATHMPEDRSTYVVGRTRTPEQPRPDG